MSTPSLQEQQQMLRGLEEAIEGALDHFDLTLRHETTVADLCLAIASLTEGVWLNQCLTGAHPPTRRSLSRSFFAARDACCRSDGSPLGGSV